MADPRQVIILANPFSGKGKNTRRVDSLDAALSLRGITTRQVWTLDERATLLAQPDVGEQYRCIVSAGGDGSMAGVVNDLGKGGDTARTAIAMLPMGNENLFAKEFGHDGTVDHLAAAIDKLDTRTIDVGQVNGQLFTLMASAGFDADVIHRLDRWRRAAKGKGLKRVNRLSYVPQTTSALAHYRYPLLTLTADGRSVTGAHAFFFNIGYYGGGLCIGEHADPSDGKLDWIVLTRPGLIRLARYGLSILSNSHLKRDDVIHGRSERIQLVAQNDAVQIQSDGDPSGTTPATIEVRPAAMRVVQA